METPRAKRPKITIACDPCRSRKVKCDGNEPVCEPCRKRGKPDLCHWSAGAVRSKARSTTADRVQQLENRIKELQATVKLHSTTGTDNVQSEEGPQHSSHDPLESSRGRTDTAGSSPITSTWPSNNIPGNGPGTFSTAQNPQLSETGGGDAQVLLPRNVQPSAAPTHNPLAANSNHTVHAIIGPSEDEHQTEGFFGSSNAGTFMQSVKHLVEKRTRGGKTRPLDANRRTSDVLPSINIAHAVIPKPVSYVLPPRRTADRLMTLYWQNFHTLDPYLDKVQMQEDYEKVWRGDGSITDERTLLCLLNVIFALSSQMDESTAPEDRQRSAAVFYTRARDLLDVVETASVYSVQYCLLLGQYFQSTSDPHPCWVFVGSAIRTAQSLGLHLPETSERASSFRVQQLLRKVWHGCVLMDRVVSMTYGRPCMIGPVAGTIVPPPLAVDDATLLSGLKHNDPFPTSSRSPLDFFISSLKLYDIMHDVIFNFYSVNAVRGRNVESVLESSPELNDVQPSVFELSRKLSRWENDLPLHLKITARHLHNGEANPHYRDAVVLHQRHLYVRLMLLRPILSDFILSDFHSEGSTIPLSGLLSYRISGLCAIVCVKVAEEAIQLIHDETTTSIGEVGNLSAWWYNVLYLYTAATVLIAVRLSSHVLAEISEELILDRWNKAIAILEKYSAFNASIHRLTTTLRLLINAVPRQFLLKKQQPQAVADEGIFGNQPPYQASIQATGTSGSMLSSTYNTQSIFDPVREAYSSSEIDDLFSAESFSDYDMSLDPNDLSWLTTIPFAT